MSPTSTDFTDERQRAPQIPVSLPYIPTEAEKRLLAECNRESFWYRSVPFSMVGMAVTQALVAKGTLSASPRFGSLPKVAFAGFFGYMAGKIAYMNICQEKFKKLENSPLGDALRKSLSLPLSPQKPQSELSDLDSQAFDTMFQPPEAQSQMPVHTYRDDGFGYSAEPSMQTDRGGDYQAPAPPQSYMEEKEPRGKAILYDDLRTKNRENYEVTLTQKAETLKTTPKRESERPVREKDVKKNIYGDAWED